MAPRFVSRDCNPGFALPSTFIVCDISAPTRAVLDAGEVHVWRHTLDAAPSLAACWTLLSADERARASRYTFARDCRSFVAGRGLLRMLLASYTGRHASTIELRVAEHGKPILARPAELEFNVSHSHDTVILAFAARPVGVDVERLRSMPDALDLARRFFSRRELEALERLDDRRRTRGFFTCWTRKEAYLKARGEGLVVPLDSFSVSVDPEHPELVACDEAANEPLQWTLANVDVPSGYIAALAVQGEISRIVQMKPREEPGKIL